MQLIEIAIVLPILLMLLVAIAEFGRYFYVYTTLAKATRIGARYITSRVYIATEETKARNLVVCGTTAACQSGSAILPNLTTANVTITKIGGTTLFPRTVKVAITGYSYTPIFNLANWTGGQAWQNVAVSPSTTMRYMLEN